MNMSNKVKNHLRIFSALTAATMLTVSFQNCSSSVQFDAGGGLKSLKGFETASVDPDSADPTVPPTLTPIDADNQLVLLPTPVPGGPPTPSGAPDTDDNDPLVAPITGECQFAANPKLSELSSSDLLKSNNQTVNMSNAASELVIEKGNVVTVAHYSGPGINIKRADHIPVFKDVHAQYAALSARAVNVIQDLEVRAAKIKAVSIVHIKDLQVGSAGVLAGEIGKITDVYASSLCVQVNQLKFLGYKDFNGGADRIEIRGHNQGHGSAFVKEIDTVGTAHLSLEKINVGSISKIRSGMIIIKDADIGKIDDIEGTLVLINSKVKGGLNNFKGQIILKENSKIEGAQTNMTNASIDSSGN